MTNKIYYTDTHLKNWVHEIIRSMNKDMWRPKYIIGLSRGGLIPALMISHYSGIPMETLKVSLRDQGGTESNCWMAEDAFNGTDILIVDDINDSGSTLQWIKDDWEKSCSPGNARWDRVWNKNVRFATLINNEASKFKDVDYIGLEINKAENPQWCVFNWEAWWE